MVYFEAITALIPMISGVKHASLNTMKEQESSVFLILLVTAYC